VKVRLMFMSEAVAAKAETAGAVAAMSVLSARAKVQYL
jgi:hypothetical protein